jgi:hypothetical protein
MVMKTGKISEEDDLKVRELAARGFIANEEKDVVPTDGELRVETKQGITYRLRFGKRANISEDGKLLGAVKDDADPAKKDDKKDAPKKGDEPKAKVAKKSDTAKKADPEKAKEESRFVLIDVGFDASKFPPIPDAPDPKMPETKPGDKPADKAAEAENKKRLEDIRQLQKMQTEQARKKRDTDIANGKARAEELAGRYDRWYYVVSNDTYKKLKIEKAAFSKAKEEKKDDKTGAAPSAPSIPGDLLKPDTPAPQNPNIPSPPPSKADDKKSEPTKDKDAKSAKSDPAKPADKAPPKAESSKTEKSKDAPKPDSGKSEKPKEPSKPTSSEKMKESEKAKKPPTP